MRFNEQAHEEAGDHFTPSEVIRLMANLIYTGEQDVYRPGIYRTIYDPACGTGGMLSESEKLILSQNERAELALFGLGHRCADALGLYSDLKLNAKWCWRIAYSEIANDLKHSLYQLRDGRACVVGLAPRVFFPI